MSTNFFAPDLKQPLVVEDYLKLVPSYATIKGMFLTNLLEILGPRRDRIANGSTRYVPFRDYPLIDQVRLIPEIAAVLYPELTLREGMLRIGHSVCPAFAGSLLGKVLFSAVGNDVNMLIRAGSKSYTLSSNVGRFEVIELAGDFARVSLRDMFNFVDCYQVGIVEGALLMLGKHPRIQIRLDSLTSAEFEIRW